MSEEECKAAICRAGAEFSILALLTGSMNPAQEQRALDLARKSHKRASALVNEIAGIRADELREQQGDS